MANTNDTILSVSQAVEQFTHATHQPAYARIVRPYLSYLVSHDLLIGEASANQYFEYYAQDRVLGYNVKSPVRKFLAYAQAQSIEQVAADPSVAPMYEELIARYLEDEIKLKDSSKRQYFYTLSNYFVWVDAQELTFSYQSVAGYLQYLTSQQGAMATSKTFLTAIKKLVRWMVSFPDRVPEQVERDTNESLMMINYL